jgi:hypothetical protein
MGYTLSYLPLSVSHAELSGWTDSDMSKDPSLADLVERVLPLGTYYTGISAFIEQRSHLDFGLVNHALCAAMRVMLKVRSTVYCLKLTIRDYVTGLPHPCHATRTCLQLILPVQPPETLVLRSSDGSHARSSLPAQHRARHRGRIESLPFAFPLTVCLLFG